MVIRPPNLFSVSNIFSWGDFHAVAAAHNLLGAALDSRMIHETNQKPKTLFKNLCPKKKGERKFAAPMLRRLERLGINKAHPDELNDDEIEKFACLNLDHDQILWRVESFGEGKRYDVIFWESSGYERPRASRNWRWLFWEELRSADRFWHCFGVRM